MIFLCSRSLTFFRTSKNGLNFEHFAKITHKIAKCKFFSNIYNEEALLSEVMSQSIPTGYIPPPGNPRENFFERANPGRPGKFFCLIPCPGAKMMVKFPGGGAKFSKIRRNSPLSLQKILKKFRKLRDSTNFLFGELKKTFIF